MSTDDIIIKSPEDRVQGSKLLGELRSRDDELARLRRELQSRDDELAQLRALVMSIYGSGSWRVTRPLRVLRRIAQALKRQSARLVGGGGIRLLFGSPAVRNSAAAPTASTETELLELSPQRHELDLQKVRRLAAARQRQKKLGYRPLLSLLMATYNTRPIFLEAAVRSAMAQAYPIWELRIVDDGSSNSATLEALERISSWDERIVVIRNLQNSGIAAATNDALKEARGEYVAVLHHEDELFFDTLYEVVLALNLDLTTDVVYTDQGYVSPEGEPAGHLFKPDWSPTFFRGMMFVGHLLTVRRSLAVEAGGFDSAFDPVQDFEFMLRISERTRKIRHVPKVLYHERRIPERAAGGGNANGNDERLQAAAVQAQLERLGLHGCAQPNPRHSRRVLIEAGSNLQNTTVDLIIHGKAGSKIAVMALEGALARTANQVPRIVVPATWTGFRLASKTKAGLNYEKADRGDSEAGSLSRFLKERAGEFVLAMSADIAIDTDGWMELLLLAVQERDVAVVCPAVLSADGTIAHAGLVVGSDATTRPAMQGFEPESDGYAGSLSCAREISAAWADVALLRRAPLANFLTLNPVYATADFLVADLTLRATRSGLRAICVPCVKARRLATTKADADHRLDALLYQDVWGGEAVGDRFYNPNFLNVRADYT